MTNVSIYCDLIKIGENTFSDAGVSADSRAASDHLPQEPLVCTVKQAPMTQNVGRPKKVYDLSKAKDLYFNGSSLRSVARQLNVGYTTLHRALVGSSSAQGGLNTLNETK